jgi:hypothetical protein
VGGVGRFSLDRACRRVALGLRGIRGGFEVLAKPDSIRAAQEIVEISFQATNY